MAILHDAIFPFSCLVLQVSEIQKSNFVHDLCHRDCSIQLLSPRASSFDSPHGLHFCQHSPILYWGIPENSQQPAEAGDIIEKLHSLLPILFSSHGAKIMCSLIAHFLYFRILHWATTYVDSQILRSDDMSTNTWLVWFWLTVSMAETLSSTLTSWINARFTGHLQNNMEESILIHYLSLSKNFHDQRKTGLFRKLANSSQSISNILFRVTLLLGNITDLIVLSGHHWRNYSSGALSTMLCVISWSALLSSMQFLIKLPDGTQLKSEFDERISNCQSAEYYHYKGYLKRVLVCHLSTIRFLQEVRAATSQFSLSLPNIIKTLGAA